MKSRMKSKIISSMVATGLSCLAIPVYGVTSTQTPAQLTRQLQKISLQAASLQKEMLALKSELRELKKAKRLNAGTDPEEIYQQEQARKGKKMPYGVVYSKEGTWNGLLEHAPTVTTSPYMGLRTAFDGSDLLTNLPSMGEDLRLLRQRQQLAKSLKGAYPYAERPVIELSGEIEALAFASKRSGAKNRNDIDLASAQLDILAEVSPWAFGFMTFNYDGGPLDPALTASPVGSRISNSNLYLKRGFITLGNLDESPFYLSAGQMFTDFGRYSSALISSPMTLVLGRVNARQVSVGYAQESGLSASAYAFKGATSTGNAGVINQGGANLRYKHDFGHDHTLNAGVGVISNIAESGGMQNTGLGADSGRQGFAVTPGAGLGAANEVLVRRAPAVDVHAEIGLGHAWTLMAEYIATVKAFSPMNVTYNGMGAKPTALHLELNRSFDVFGKPANASIAYDHSEQAYAIGLPRNSFMGVFNISPIKNTVASIEFRHDKSYSAGTTGITKGTAVTPIVVPALASSNNTVWAQFGIYF